MARTEKKVLIVGCGYLGAAIAARLRDQGALVTAWVRSPETAATLSAEDFQVVTGDVAHPESWSSITTSFDMVVHSASSSRGGPDIYAQVYREGMRQIISHQPQARLLFVSSTSVYGQTSGEFVDETSPANPSTETGKILREAEEIALKANGIVVRASGIYGPDRGVLWQKFLKGEAVIEGDGLRWINQIHRDDLAAAIILLLNQEATGIFNASDDHPTTYLEFYRWCAETTGHQMPPFGPINTQRKRGLTNKRVSNQKLKSLDWTPRYPSFREGLTTS